MKLFLNNHYNNYNKQKQNKMKVTINTTYFSQAGRDCARTMFMYLKTTKEHQDAIKQFNKYKEQALNPKSEMEFECAKAFILAGNQFNQEIDNANSK